MSNNKGFTLVEMIIAVLLLAIAIVPMVGAYGPAIFSTAVEDEVGVFTNQARGTLNRVATHDVFMQAASWEEEQRQQHQSDCQFYM